MATRVVNNTALVRSLEHERTAVSYALREETAQVLGSVLLHLAALCETRDVDLIQIGLTEVRGAVRSELAHVLQLAARLNLDSPPSV
jgi:hypothetical protein